MLSLVEPADKAVKEIKLPLRHEDIIRQQAADKNVDPTLIAAVIYTESRFRDQTSHVGAKGLMQIMPETADYIARKSGGTRFERADLATPQINIAYGTWYLRYLLDEVPRQHDPHPGRLQRGGGQGRRVVARGVEPRREVPRRRPHPVQGDPRLRRPRAVRARRLPRELQARAERGITADGARVNAGIAATAPTFTPGSEFAGYRIDEVAGRGGMGVVFRATQLALGRPVALKLIATAYASDIAFRERFKREWETAAAIDHPNVIPLYEAGEANDHLFIAMRWVEGRDLSYLLHYERQLAADRAVRIISQLAAALDAAHARGLVHRDVKPANVLVAAEDHVYLTDFGLSQGRRARAG